MNSKENQKKRFLLPNFFKKIGIALMLLMIVFAITFKIIQPNISVEYKEYYKLFSGNLLLLGFFFFAFSRDKIEDEMTLLIRLNSIAFAFAWIILLILFTPIFDLLFDGKIIGLTSRQIVLNMLVCYLGMYYFQKKFR